ncbi:hypothetical protein LXL04_028910 [Taraxacum kok-saghyz]
MQKKHLHICKVFEKEFVFQKNIFATGVVFERFLAPEVGFSKKLAVWEFSGIYEFSYNLFHSIFFIFGYTSTIIFFPCSQSDGKYIVLRAVRHTQLLTSEVRKVSDGSQKAPADPSGPNLSLFTSELLRSFAKLRKVSADPPGLKLSLFTSEVRKGSEGLRKVFAVSPDPKLLPVPRLPRPPSVKTKPIFFSEPVSSEPVPSEGSQSDSASTFGSSPPPFKGIDLNSDRPSSSRYGARSPTLNVA